MLLDPFNEFVFTTQFVPKKLRGLKFRLMHLSQNCGYAGTFYAAALKVNRTMMMFGAEDDAAKTFVQRRFGDADDEAEFEIHVLLPHVNGHLFTPTSSYGGGWKNGARSGNFGTQTYPKIGNGSSLCTGPLGAEMYMGPWIEDEPFSPFVPTFLAEFDTSPPLCPSETIGTLFFPAVDGYR